MSLPLTPDEDEIKQYVLRELVKREGLRRLAALDSAEIVIPELVSLTDLLAAEEPGTRYRIEGWQPENSRVILAAQNKAGKTTSSGNLVRSLVDGDPWLGVATVNPVSRVTVIDNEMSRSQAVQWLRDQGIRNTDAVQMITMRNRERREAKFNILDDRIRSQWADVLRGTDYLIFDCLRPALDALGLDEQRDVGKFLTPFDELLAEAGIPDALIVHHMGHSSGRSRGDSRLRDWPDVEWSLERADGNNPASARTIRAYGRGVDVPTGKLTFDPVTRHLSYKPVLPLVRSKQAEAKAAIERHLLAHGAAKQTDLEALATATTGFSRNDIRAVLGASQSAAGGPSWLRCRQAQRRAKVWELAADSNSTKH